jgi:hypothetical protein
VIDDREKVGVRVIIKSGRYKLGGRWIEVRAHVYGGVTFWVESSKCDIN